MKKTMAIAVSALILSASTAVLAGTGDGEALFNSSCGKCHEEGGTKAIPEDDIKVIKGLSADKIQAAFNGGVEAPKKMLKAWDKFSDAEKAAVIDYLSK
ncbi:MAG: cytochrome c [Gammaproteobacteria bacterium]|nr:cytochrome c [Gammaproteobacteria bacterium]